MGKKLFLLLAALLLAVGSHLRLCCDCTVADTQLILGCTPAAAGRAQAAARAAAEELCRGEAQLPEARRRLRLTLRRPTQTAQELSDALLRAAPGVEVCDGVYADGRRLGCVEDGVLFSARLRRYIFNTTPTWAVGGLLSTPVELRREYCRAGKALSADDMVLMVTGAVPVFYYDLSGNMARA